MSESQSLIWEKVKFCWVSIDVEENPQQLVRLETKINSKKEINSIALDKIVESYNRLDHSGTTWRQKEQTRWLLQSNTNLDQNDEEKTKKRLKIRDLEFGQNHYGY